MGKLCDYAFTRRLGITSSLLAGKQVAHVISKYGNTNVFILDVDGLNCSQMIMSGPVLSHAQRISLASRQSSMIQSQYSTLFLKDLVELLVWSVTYVNLKKEANYTKPLCFF